MKFLNGVTLLLVYQLTGEILVRLLGLPIPGPVLGMVMLYAPRVFRLQVTSAVPQATTGRRT